MNIASSLGAIGSLKNRLLSTVKRMLLGTVGFAVAGLLALIASAFLVSAAWVVLREHFGTTFTNLGFGVLLLLVALVLTLWARAMIKSKVIESPLPAPIAKVDADKAASDLLSEENLGAAATLMLGVGYLIGNKLFAKAPHKSSSHENERKTSH